MRRPSPVIAFAVAGCGGLMAMLYFAMRAWTCLAFIPTRLKRANEAHSADTMTRADLDQPPTTSYSTTPAGR